MISPSLTNITGSTEGLAPATLQVDVIADLICPWSYLGKRRLDEALEAVHGPSQVSWHPFQINPTMPESGLSFNDYLRSKFGDPETIRPGLEGLTEAGRQAGINFRFDRLKRVPNTIKAHQLLQFAQSNGCDPTQMAEAIMQAFFEHGRDIGDTDVLVQLGEAAGLEASAIRAALDDGTLRSIVTAEEAQVRQNGVTGVPAFLINKRLFVIGAQPTESLVNIFDRAMFGEESDLEVSTTVH
jgi:predicted DsbA family dithiol-disulfide isomerase